MDKQQILELLNSTVGPVLGKLVAGLLGAAVFYVLVTRREKRKEVQRQLHAFPFAEHTVAQLLAEPDRGDSAVDAVDYVVRSSISSVSDEVQKSNRILITGRPGIGKTREAKEAIRGLDESSSDNIVVFTANPGANEFIGRPQRREVLPAKRPVLFIDDIDDFYRAELLGGADSLDLDPFDQRFRDAVDWFAAQNENTVVIVTAEDTSFIPKSAESQVFWNDYREVHVPDIHSGAFGNVVRHLEGVFGLALTRRARQYLQSESDSTFQGMLESFFKLSRLYPDGSHPLDVTDLMNAELPANWNVDGLQRELAADASRLHIFDVLAALRRLGIPAYLALVAACTARLMGPFRRGSRTRHMHDLVRDDLQKWLHVSSEGVLLCPEAYLHDKGRDIAAIAQSLPKSIQAAQPHQQGDILWKCYNAYSYLRKQMREPLLASRFARSLVRYYPRNVSAWNALRTACLVEGNRRGALRASKHLARLGRDPVAFHYLSRAYGNLASARSGWWKQRLHRKAVSCAKEAIHLDPQYVPAYTSLQINYAELGQHQEALPYAKKSAEMRGSSRDWYRLAAAYGKNGMHSEAVEAARKSIVLDAQFIPAREGLVINLGEAGNKTEEALAIQELAELSDEEGHWEQAWAVHSKNADYAKAEHAARQLVGSHPDNQNYRSYLFQCLYRQDKYAEAEQYGSLDDLQGSSFSVAVDRAKAEGYPHTLSLIRIELAESPDDFEKWNVLGATLRKYAESEEGKALGAAKCQELLAEAVQAHENAASRVGGSATTRQRASVFYAKALAYRSAGQFGLARKACEEALETDPGYPKAKKLMGELRGTDDRTEPK